MKKVVIEAYEFSELDEDAKHRANEEYNTALHEEYFELDTVVDIIKKLDAMFGTRLEGWSFDGWQYDPGRVMVPGVYEECRIDDEEGLRGVECYEHDWLFLTGTRAMAKLNTLFGPGGRDSVFEGKYYFSKGIPGPSRRSKCQLTADDCPLSGMCFDCDALGPLLAAMDGKRVGDGSTIADIITECYDALIRAANEDLKYQQSEEAFGETADANGWLFDEGGSMIDYARDNNACA